MVIEYEKEYLEELYNNGKCTNKKYRFVLVNENGVWKIDEVKYGFGEQDKWYIDHI